MQQVNRIGVPDRVEPPTERRQAPLRICGPVAISAVPNATAPCRRGKLHEVPADLTRLVSLITVASPRLYSAHGAFNAFSRPFVR